MKKVIGLLSLLATSFLAHQSFADTQSNFCFYSSGGATTPCPVDALGNQINSPSGNPASITATSTGTTITSGGTFQIALAANSGPVRKGCTVQNNGSHTMFVFFKNADTASDAKSMNIAAGQQVNCNVPGGNGVLQNEIDIDGTTSDAFSVTVSK